MATSLLTLLDDVATILDDVAVMTKLATKKTAGVLGDDLALNAQQVTGVRADRELPVVWAVAKGSAWNKVILVPIALLISVIAPWAKKLAHKFFHADEVKEEREQLIELVGNEEIDLVEMEKGKIKGAIRTDFVLSAEIIVIALGTAGAATFSVQVATLIAISMIMTIGVYGLVAGIVKLDDLGLYLSQPSANPVSKALGSGILWFAPLLMKFLSVVGTAAMFIVGGGILTHGVHWLAERIHEAASGVSGLPVFSDIKGIGSFAEQITTTLLNTAVGIVAGIAALLVYMLFQKLRGKPAH